MNTKLSSRPLLRLFSLLALCVLAASIAYGQDVRTLSEGLDFAEPQQAWESAVLTVSGPAGIETFRIDAGSPLSLTVDHLADLAALNGRSLDGNYSYELRFVPSVNAETRDMAANLREAEAAGRLSTRLFQPLVQAIPVRFGSFTVQAGSIADPDLAESTATRSAAVQDAAGVTTRDQQINDDLIVTQSLCVGQDCSNGESFGFDTIRTKENNLRIKFQDTSNTASFPSRDWELTANDSSNGGANKFSITDIDGARVPFTLEAGAPSNSLYVDDGGRLGLGSSTPVTQLHMVDGNTPTYRLEQDGSSGFTPQTWDLAGNEANFFIRDVTNGSELVFRIFPDAPGDALTIKGSSGHIGLGTSTPDSHLHIRDTGSNIESRVQSKTDTWVQTWDADLNRTTLSYTDNGTADATIQTAFKAGASTWHETYSETQYSLSLSATPGTEQLLVDSSGNLTTTGTVNGFSDRNAKENFAAVNSAQVLERLIQVPILHWNYRDDGEAIPHLGPVAQDFYEAFKLGASERHISYSDADGVALAAIQELYRQLLDSKSEIEALRSRLQEMEERQSSVSE